MDNNVRRLRDVQNLSADDDLRVGPPPCKVRVVGDPEIIDAKGNKFHYYGPALLVNLDTRGMVRSLEFVGVTSDDDYISEVWQLDVKTRTYKYRNLSGTPTSRIGTRSRNDPEPEFQAGAVSWDSEAQEEAMPPKSFLQKFKRDSHTFFIDCRSGMFVRGPKYGVLQAVIENPSKFLKPLFAACSMEADAWMQQAADVITTHHTNGPRFSKPCREMQAVQVAQLVYGLTACVIKS